MQPDGYVAPARYPLAVLHRLDPDAGADLFSDVERIDGYTVCALPLLESELWMPVQRREGDTMCWVCEAEGRGAGAAEDVQEALL